MANMTLVLFYFLALMLPPVARAAENPQTASVERFRTLLAENLALLSDPMLGVFHPDRALAVSKIVPSCRKGKAYVECVVGKKERCPEAAGCVVNDRSEDPFIFPNKTKLQAAQELVRDGFENQLAGARRKFSLHVVNAMITDFNKATIAVDKHAGAQAERFLRSCSVREQPAHTHCVFKFFGKETQELAKLLRDYRVELERRVSALQAEIRSYSE